MGNWIKYIYYWMVKEKYTVNEMCSFIFEESGAGVHFRPWPAIHLYPKQKHVPLQNFIDYIHIKKLTNEELDIII